MNGKVENSKYSTPLRTSVNSNNSFLKNLSKSLTNRSKYAESRGKEKITYTDKGFIVLI